ncbi:MAG: Uncharacterised protein [SAR116 cluster bacterium MED-G04]|nr:MAG: Uncharacterised protein [SAR116 cluster bacterium MED-G04]
MAWPFVLLAVIMLSVVGVLFWGLTAMARGGEYNLRWSNKIMRWRVLLQGLAILVFVGVLLISSV